MLITGVTIIQPWDESIDLRESWTIDIRTEEIQDRIRYMLEIGIPKSLIEIIRVLKPTLFHKEEVFKKIEALKKLGFADPVKMITSLPAILGYNIEKNIEPKLTILIKMIGKYNLPYTAVSLMESNPLFFSSKRDKIWILIRILSTKLWSDINIKTRVSQLLNQNLESVFIANIENPNLVSIKELIQESKKVKAKYSTKEKRIIISSYWVEIPIDKTLARYSRWYNK